MGHSPVRAVHVDHAEDATLRLTVDDDGTSVAASVQCDLAVQAPDRPQIAGRKSITCSARIAWQFFMVAAKPCDVIPRAGRNCAAYRRDAGGRALRRRFLPRPVPGGGP